jgi:hypothetical protein
MVWQKTKERRNPLGQITIDLRLVFNIPSSKLTINGLIHGVKESSSQIHEAIITTLLEAIETRVVQRYMDKDPMRYRKNGHQSKPRQMSCSLCTFSYRFAQLSDRKTGRSFMPLAKALSIPSHIRFLEEALEPCIGLCMHVSYRRAAKEIERIKDCSMSHTTIHRRLQGFAQDHEPFDNLKKRPFRFLLVDGTKVRLQGQRGKNLGLVEMRWALASEGPQHHFEPVGFWLHTEWKTIREDLSKRLDYGKLEILFSDGAPGAEQALLSKKMIHQRCLWHGKRDFPYLLYADGFKKADQQPFVKQLNAIPAMMMSKAQLEQLRHEDRPQVEQIIELTQQKFSELITALHPDKYPKARSYIQNLIKPVSSFLFWWLKKGEAIPLNTNAIESAFSQVNNRIKRIGRRWSDKGLLNWLKVVFYKIFRPDLWHLQWVDNTGQFVKIKLMNLEVAYHCSKAIT